MDKPCQRRKQLNTKIETRHASRLSVFLCTVSICVIAIHFCFLYVFPHIFAVPRIFGRTWGFHFITYFSAPVQAAFYALALALCVPPVAPSFANLLSRPFSDKVKSYLSQRKEILFVSVSVLSIPVFRLLNAKYALLGDNFGIVERAVNNTFMPDECGAIFILHCFYKVMHALFSMDGIGSIRVFSNLCGGVFIYLSLRIAQEMGTTFLEKVSIFLFYVSFLRSSIFAVMLKITPVPSCWSRSICSRHFFVSGEKCALPFPPSVWPRQSSYILNA